MLLKLMCFEVIYPYLRLHLQRFSIILAIYVIGRKDKFTSRKHNLDTDVSLVCPVYFAYRKNLYSVYYILDEFQELYANRHTYSTSLCFQQPRIWHLN